MRSHIERESDNLHRGAHGEMSNKQQTMDCKQQVHAYRVVGVGVPFCTVERLAEPSFTG